MNKKVFVFFAILLLGSLNVSWSNVSAQEVNVSSVDPQARERNIQTRIDELQNQIKIFSEAEREDVALGLGVTLEQLQERTEILRETKGYYTQQLQALQKLQSLSQERETLKGKISTGEILEIDKSPPYSLNYYDDFNLKLMESKRNQDTARLAVSVAERVLRDAKDRHKEAGSRMRQLKSEAGEAKDHQTAQKNQWLIDQAGREEELALAVMLYQELNLANTKEEAELSITKTSLYRQVVESIRANLHFDQTDLDKQLNSIDQRKKELQDRSSDLKKDLRKATRELDKTLRKVEEAKAGNEIGKAKSALSAAEQWRQAYRVQLDQVEKLLEHMHTRKQLWKNRYDLVKGDVKREYLSALKEEALKLRDRFQQSLLLEQERQTSLQLQIGKIEEQLQQDGLSWDAKSNLNEHRKALVELVGSTINFITALTSTSQMNAHFIEELDRAHSNLSFKEIVSVTIATLKSWWRAELFVFEEQALTVGKIAIAIGILILGIIFTRLFSQLLQKRLLVRLNLSTSSAAIAGKMIHYTVLLIVILFVMRIVNIPLTAFTFLGGAIAIGVGFGAQKLINNFISCFILMAEQPIKVGDLIMMDNEQCWIEDIGARCTKVRTYSNINILVPNSYFLENNITNWTHSDNIVRGRVTVGVAYGSDTRKVNEMLLKAASEHGEVRKHPDPYVFFGDFGDNALIFELYFWVTVTQNIGIQRISSDLRFMIDENFRDAGITVAFPQRDLHFDSGKPIQIQMSRTKPE